MFATPKSGEKRKSLRRSMGLYNLDAAAAGQHEPEQESPLSRTPSRKRHAPLTENMIRYWRSNVAASLNSPEKENIDVEEVNPRASTATLTPANVAEHVARETANTSGFQEPGNRTGSSFESSRPLACAFSSSGLVSKSQRPTRPTPRQMPETPCKRRPESLIFDLDDRPDSSRLLWTSPFSDVTKNVENFSLGAQESPTRMSPPVSFSRPLTSTPGPSRAQRFPTDATITPGGLRRPGLSLSAGTHSSPTMLNTSVQSARSTLEFSDDTTWSRDSHDTADTSVDSIKEPFRDSYLQVRFRDVQHIGAGEFSCVWSVSSGSRRFAVKRSKKQLVGARMRARRYEEVEILKSLSPGPEDNIIALEDAWEDQGYLYIMTEYCENGNLDRFLSELGTRLDEWRVWKILLEITYGLKFIHERNFCHLDIKPANVFITFDGSLKIGDFGMATSLPAPLDTEREGDREYIAPEVLSSGKYDTPADIFSLGIMMVEVAANIILPDNGEHWQKLRSGDLSDAGRLSSGDLQRVGTMDGPPEWAPYFMVDDSQALDGIVRTLLSPEVKQRPTANQILALPELQVVDSRRQAGAIVYEGDFGPGTEVRRHGALGAL